MFLKSIYIYFFYVKASNFHNSVVVGRRKLPDLSLNNIFSAPSIGLQYTLSFKQTDFGLKSRPYNYEAEKKMVDS